ncbi:MAG: hypothetical protein IT386_15960 [Deltaproteobacteria bacterium]|nr:hypothetical protein [Deltaproteobacteria bacterium]
MFLATLRQKLCSTRVLAASAAVFVLSQVTIAVILRDVGSARVLRAQTTFSATTLRTIIEQWQREGVLSHYYAHFVPDFLHPVWYALLLGALLARGLDSRGLPDRWNTVLLLPFVAGALDLVENLLHLVFLCDLDRVSQPLVAVSALAANLKWALVAASIAGTLWLRPWRSERA